MDNLDRLYARLNPPRQNLPKGCPHVILSLTAFKKIRMWCQLGAELNDIEISGLGTVTPRHGGLFVNDIWLIRPEKVGAAHVDMDGKSVQELMMEVMTRGPKFKQFRDQLAHYYRTGEFTDMDAFEKFADILTKSKQLRNLRMMWHSHNNFGVGWSGTDDRTARRDFCPEAPWTINIVTNADGHFLARQDFPKTQGEPIHELPVWLFVGVTSKLSKKYREEYRNKVQSFLDSRCTDNGPAAFDEIADVIEEAENNETPTSMVLRR